MPRPSAVRYTYADYLSIPEDPSRHYEIVDGELFVTRTPRARHQEVAFNLARILADLSDAHGLGKVYLAPITVHLHNELVVEPDVLFVREGRLGIIDPDGAVEGPPDLLVEVLSPANRDYDRNLKRKHYLENEVPEVWIVDADAGTVEVWRPGDAEAQVVRDVLVWGMAGQRFGISLAEVFRS